MKRLFNSKPDPCTEFIDSLPAFRDGILPEDTHTKLEMHRMDCASCQKVLMEEQKVSSLMAEIQPAEVPLGFRDKVLREWRLRRDTVKKTIPAVSIGRIQVALAAVLVWVLLLPMVRLQLLSSGHKLIGTLDRLPPEYREGIDITFNVPTFAEMSATFMVWQGGILESMGELGSVIAPWSGWLWSALVVTGILAAVHFFFLKSKLPMRDSKTQKSKESM